MISIVVPSHNNLRHLKNAYQSIRKHGPEVEIVMIDDASTDGTYEWMNEVYKEDNNVIILKSDDRKGHTILYDLGIEHATNQIVGIMHADMIMGPNYVENTVKHLKPGTVVCGTRVEPPLHPAGKEKIIHNFGLDFDDLNIPAFEEFCKNEQTAMKDQKTKGMFAPWVIYKEDFNRIGGHDPIFAPFPYEDSDIFQRWILQGYELIQSRDALVYHLTCRGHRWTEEIQKDDDNYKKFSYRAARNYLRKWGSWISNDEYQYPIIKPRYNIGFVISGNIGTEVLDTFEPWCDTIYVDDPTDTIVSAYIKKEQHNTTYDMKERVKKKPCEVTNDIVVEFYIGDMSNDMFNVIMNLQSVLEEAEEGESYELDKMIVTVKKKVDRRNELIFINKRFSNGSSRTII